MIIKPSSGNSLVFQDEGGDAALTVGTTGNTTLAGSANNIGTTTAGTLSSGVTFPAGHIIKATSNMYNSAQSDNFGNSYATVTASGNNHWQGSITDVAANSWVWIVTTFTLRVESSSTSGGAGVKINRNLDTDLFPVIEYDLYQWGSNSGSGISVPVTMSWMDKTPITGTNTYYLKGMDYGGSTTAYVYSSSNSRPFSMECFEIAQ